MPKLTINIPEIILKQDCSWFCRHSVNIVSINNGFCRLPSFTEDQKKLLKGTADFLALNYYSVSFAEHHDLSKEKNVTWGYHTDQEMKASRDPAWLKGQSIGGTQVDKLFVKPDPPLPPPAALKLFPQTLK